MSMERTVCELVKQYWDDLYPNSQPPGSLIYLKVAGKISPNAAIIAIILDARCRQPVAVAKIPRNPQVATGIEREYEAMLDIRNSIRNPHILKHMPWSGILAEKNGVKILLQAVGMGHPMVREMSSRESVEELYSQILPWMLDFHAHGAEKCVLESEVLQNLVEIPITRFMDQFSDVSAKILSVKARQYLSELPQKVKGRTVHLCRQHGDFNAHNIFVEYDHGRLSNFTLIDWEDYRPRQLPIHDLNHFFTSNSHLLSNGMSPKESYAKFVLNEGWYRDLYVKEVADYEGHNLVERYSFWMLTPLYFLHECMRTTNIDRKQESTAPVWIERLNLFIRQHLMYE